MDKREPREGAEVIKLSSAERREDREAFSCSKPRKMVLFNIVSGQITSDVLRK